MFYDMLLYKLCDVNIVIVKLICYDFPHTYIGYFELILTIFLECILNSTVPLNTCFLILVQGCF